MIMMKNPGHYRQLPLKGGYDKSIVYGVDSKVYGSVCTIMTKTPGCFREVAVSGGETVYHKNPAYQL